MKGLSQNTKTKNGLKARLFTGTGGYTQPYV